MTTLITGGAGFIGSRLALRLLDQHEPIVILDNFDPFYDPALKRGNIAAIQAHANGANITVYEGDIRDEALLARIFAEHPIKRVAHLAALGNVRYSIERGRMYADVNTSATVSLMDVSRKHDVKVFVFASTSSVYGNTDQVPFREADLPDFPLAPYPASKRAAELFGHTYFNLFGLNVTVLRFFNCYGAHGRPDMMPIRAIDSILNEKPIIMWGGGLLERDWTYVDDTVSGIVAALNTPMGYEIINMGYGSPVTLLAFIQIYEQLIGKQAIIQHEPAPPSEPRITYCDNTRARERLGFNPQIDLQEGLARTWAWYQAQFLA